MASDPSEPNGHSYPPQTTETSDSSWQRVSHNNSDDTNIDSFDSVERSEKPSGSSSFTKMEFVDKENEEDSEDDDEFESAEELLEVNLETALKYKSEGNRHYQSKEYDQALIQYTMAIQSCPVPKDKDNENEDGYDDANNDQNDDQNEDQNGNDEKKENETESELNATLNHHLCVFHANRGACHIALGDWESAIEECSESIGFNKEYLKAYWRRAKAYEKLEKYHDAKQDYQSILDMEPNHEIAKQNLERIEPLVQAQFEKQKKEVIDNLKGFANWGLGKLGLSLDNFEAQQNPETGAYNINFKQNT